MDLCIERQISPESFYVHAHSLLYETFLAMHQDASHPPIDMLTIIDRLQVQGDLDAIGGEELLGRLYDETPTVAHAEYYIQRVYENHLLRKIIDSSREVERHCLDREKSADEILNDAEETFYSLSERKIGVERTWKDVVKTEMEEIEALLKEKKGITGISTGFRDIDKMLLGLQKTDLIILAARPSMGKTSLALNIAEHVATGAFNRHPPRAVAVFSLEMSSESLVRRMLCCRAQIPSQQLSIGAVSKEAHGSLMNAANDLSKARIFVDDTAGLEAPDLRARARRLKRKHEIDLIIVDYLQLMNYSKFASEGRQRETSAISQSLKAMAKELKVPVIVLSQLSRAPETRGGASIPKLSDLRDSGAIEQDADIVFLLRRPCKYPTTEGADDPTLAILDIAKHRNGPTGELKLNFEDRYTRFSDRFDPGEHGET